MNEEPFGPLALISSFRSTRKRSPKRTAALRPGRLRVHPLAKRATAAIAEIEAGMVTINHYGLALPEVPFGGIKESGYGSEGGTEAIEAYLNTKFASL